jgi:Sec-independent protein secretion pathway component TatC
MSNFRTSQNQANPNKLNSILSTLIFILILNVTMQIWLLYASLNYALENNRAVLIPAFIASFVLFLIGFSWLYYLPSGYKRIK